MSVEQAIVPYREQNVVFYGDNIPAAQIEGGDIFVPLRPLAQFLGLAPQGQQARVQRDSVLSARVRYVMITSSDGKRYSNMCLPIDLLPGWLFGITTNKVREELRDKLNLYRAECFSVLWRAFRDDILPASQQQTTGLSPAQQMLQQAEALAALARHQVEIEEQQKRMAGYMRPFIERTRSTLATHDDALTNHEQRLVSIELRLDPAAQITDEQAAEIALGVKNVAYAMSGGSRSYGKVYSELYRRYRISSYKNLPRAKYDEVIAWLSRWFEELAGDDKDEDKTQD